MPTPTILNRRGNNVRFHKGDEMTPEAHTIYRLGRFVYTRYAATIQIFVDTVCNIEVNMLFLYIFISVVSINATAVICLNDLSWISKCKPNDLNIYRSVSVHTYKNMQQ